MAVHYDPYCLLREVYQIREKKDEISQLLHYTLSAMDVVCNGLEEHNISRIAGKYRARFDGFIESFSQFDQYLEQFITETEQYFTPIDGKEQ